MAEIKAFAVAGADPTRTYLTVPKAVEKALKKSGLGLGQIDLIEVQEAFAAQVLADLKMMGLKEKDYPRVNVNGSGISLGHPIACTGTRVLVTLSSRDETAQRPIRSGNHLRRRRVGHCSRFRADINEHHPSDLTEDGLQDVFRDFIHCVPFSLSFSIRSETFSYSIRFSGFSASGRGEPFLQRIIASFQTQGRTQFEEGVRFFRA